MSAVAFSNTDFYTQITTGDLGTACATFVSQGGSTGLQGIYNIVNNVNGAGAAFEADIAHDDMQQEEVATLPDYGEWALMSPNEIATWDSILGTQVVKVGNTNIQNGFEAAFANAPNSLASVRTVYTQKGSWAQGRYGKFTNGVLTVISTDQIQDALTNH